MFPPGTSQPFISQNPDIMYTQLPGMQGQPFTQDFMSMPQLYPLQDPQSMFGDSGFSNNSMVGDNSFGSNSMFEENRFINNAMFEDNRFNNMGMFEDNRFSNMGMSEDNRFMKNSNVRPEANARRDPPPLLSNNPATATIVLFKELTAYPNYGNPSRNADILYTGTRGTWTFESPAFLFVPGNLRAQLRISAVLDDHTNVPVNRYSARITINGTVVHNGRVPLVHGMPVGGIFNNWRDLTFNVPNLRRVNRVTIENTSNTNPDDWIGLDWMELRLMPR